MGAVYRSQSLRLAGGRAQKAYTTNVACARRGRPWCPLKGTGWARHPPGRCPARDASKRRWARACSRHPPAWGLPCCSVQRHQHYQMSGGEGARAYRLRLLSVTTHSTSSRRQFVQGAPCSTTLQRTLRARQDWQAFEARLLTARWWAALSLGSAFRLSEVASPASDEAAGDEGVDMMLRRRDSHVHSEVGEGYGSRSEQIRRILGRVGLVWWNGWTKEMYRLLGADTRQTMIWVGERLLDEREARIYW